MAIGDIQLTEAAIPRMNRAPTDTPGPDQNFGGPVTAARYAPDEKPNGRVVMGEAPTDKELPEELDDTALPRRQLEMFLWEIKHQPHWRREADRAADYYDGNQLSPETVEKLKDRGQPPLITNLIKPTIDTVLGMEAKTRTDWRVRPEDDDEANDDLAEAMSVKLKHAEIESRADRAVSDAYAAQIKAGLGWVEVAREHDPFKCPYRVRYIHRREVFWDWRAEQPDLSDARYLIRRRWLELEQAIALMPQYASLFRMTTGGWAGFDPLLEQDSRLVQSWEIERDTRIAAVDWRDIQRMRICLYEVWYRKWVRGYTMTLPNGKTIEADFNNPLHNQAIVAGYAQVKQATFQKVRLAWYTGPHFLYDVPSPYKHNSFPYVPFFGHREDLTNVPYGLIRAMISPQDEVNARKSKMLWSLNSRRTIADSDAVLDHNRAASEVARPDAYITLNANRKPNSQFRVEPGGELASQQFQVMQEAKQEISEASGIHKSMQGQQSGATSGLAINSLVEQGLNTLAEINDNYRYARRLVGEMLFELIQQNLAQGQSIVTVGEGGNKKVIQLNAQQINEQTGQPETINDVAKLKAKIVLDDVPSTPTYRMQQLQMLTEITKSLPPNLQGYVIDFVIEATDMPKRHELADRLRSVVGIQDPEQQKAAAQQQQQQAAMAQDMQQKTFVLDAAERAARIRKLNAEAEKVQNEAITAKYQPMVRTPQIAVSAPAIQ
ncbi:Phage P22-like portal protein [uncultured Caudovirales phage]|uniref:Phage P22-like portal protein n=1 Tax=uncultured Caudovirales phage TaxID=2100421 RepID=A0A6J5KKS2_9CAUD|nr:Phage P22-like portal protein [uncultured Caudovirales phage]